MKKHKETKEQRAARLALSKCTSTRKVESKKAYTRKGRREQAGLDRPYLLRTHLTTTNIVAMFCA